MNRPTTRSEIESVIKKKEEEERKKSKQTKTANRIPGPESFTGEILPNI